MRIISFLGVDQDIVEHATMCWRFWASLRSLAEASLSEIGNGLVICVYCSVYEFSTVFRDTQRTIDCPCYSVCEFSIVGCTGLFCFVARVRWGSVWCHT